MTDRGPRLKTPSSYTNDRRLCWLLFRKLLRFMTTGSSYNIRIENQLTYELLEKL